MKVLQTNGLKAFMASIRDKFISKSDTVEAETVDIDNIPTQNSNNLVKSSGVYTELATKITEPSSDLAVGKYFRIASIDSDGHAVLECVDAPTAPVQSVSAAGTALPPDENGNVNIPKATETIFGVGTAGLITIVSTSGLSNSGIGTGLWCRSTSNTAIETRGKVGNVVPVILTNDKLDYTVKCAMTDGIGATWTDAERLAALLRMGCTVDENGFVKWTATPSE